MKQKSSKLGRRKFLTGVGTLTLGSLRTLNQACSGKKTLRIAEEKFPKVPKRKLGKTGLDVPVLILGAGMDLRNRHALLSTTLQY